MPNSELPWRGSPDEVGCNVALGNLVASLPARLKVDGRVHAETYVAGVGAIAGFAAQRTLFAAHTDGGLRLQRAMTAAGGQFWFGDALNDMLWPGQGKDPARCLWPVAAGAAISAGLPRERLPDAGPMFAHVAGALGSEREGWPSVPVEHLPHLAALPLLKLVWPVARACFAGLDRSYGAAPVAWWAAIAAWAAGKPIGDVASVLAPELALTIAMETAILCSKVEAALIEPA